MLIPKVEQRITQYLHFLESAAYRKLSTLEFQMFETEKTYREPPEAAEWVDLPPRGEYGVAWHCAWFRASFRSPETAGENLFLQVVPNADSLAFLDGQPIGAFNPFHKKLRIPADGLDHVVHVEAYAGHPYPGMHPFQDESVMLTLSRQIPRYPNVFEGGALLERNPVIYAFYYDVRALLETALSLDANSLRRARILKGLYGALMDIRFSSTGTDLDEEVRRASARVAPLLAAKNGDSTPEIHLVGHAHVDHAWLWHIGETERKVARTYANMVRLSQEYPEFVFIQSQPAQLDIVRREYPEIFSAVVAAYERGSWEPNGGMWVEADCNVTGGESLIRQFLVGKAATEEMLGYEADTLWLPDVFGYAAALPQILSGCGIEYFVTSKISWNDTTRFPYDTFLWRGIDGTAVKTHFITSRTEGYNGRVSAEGLWESWREVQHKEVQSAVVKSIGEGDGGGGTTRADLELARRFADLEGAPKARWRKVSEALRRIFDEHDEWPEWRGELYLELHRGTYTTQARTKRYNRKLEFALRGAEFLSAVAESEGLLPYPRAELDACWKLLLTNQFHDIIPGSSIARVYAEAEADYRKIETILAGIAERERGVLAGLAGGDAVVFNDLSWERGDPVVFPAEALGVGSELALRSAGGEAYPVQRFRGLDGEELAVCAPRLPPMGWAGFRLVDAPVPASPFAYDGTTLETPFYLIRFDGAGRLTSLLDKRRRRELVKADGAFNAFVSAEDVPVLWEAWDLEADWQKSAVQETALLSTEVAADGPVCFRLRRKYRIGSASLLQQDMAVYAEDPRIDFDTVVDWRERRRVLKVAFDTAVDASEVRCEVQYGHAMRNTHRNLSADRAKFEICAHKWILMEEEGGGVALLNDCKYGHDVEGGRMRLTLLRAPTAPDPEADLGEHRFVYSLLPFSGTFGDSRVVVAAYELNAGAAVTFPTSPRAATAPAVEAASYSFCSVEGDAVLIEAVKAAEAAGGALVLRLYESLGGRARTTLRFPRDLAGAVLTDMLERGGQELAVSGRELSLEFHPFEIKTLVLRFVPR